MSTINDLLKGRIVGRSAESKYDELLEKAFNEETNQDDLTLLTEEEKVFYVLYTFDLEWNNGGLCQFFSNSSGDFAPLISKCLEEVGAMEHKKLYDSFINDNKINVNDLSFFKIDYLEEFKDKVEAYPFDEFDDEYSQLDELEDFIEKYYNEKLK